MGSSDKKVILITGASDGIGKETAKSLAKQGHNLIIHGRSKDKTAAALAEIRNTSGNPDVHMYLADFLSLSSVKAFADAVKRDYAHIDVLINNAGAQFSDRREETVDGHEKTMAINVFAPMLLTLLLLDRLKESASGRVVTVASDSHRISGKIDLDDIELKNRYSMPRAYAQSKLYIIWVMSHLIKEAKKAGIQNVTFTTVHPGATMSSLARESAKSLKWRILFSLYKPFMISMDKAIAPSIQAAISPSLEGVTGKYLGPKGDETPSAKNYTPENEKRVWDYAMSVIRPYLSA